MPNPHATPTLPLRGVPEPGAVFARWSALVPDALVDQVDDDAPWPSCPSCGLAEVWPRQECPQCGDVNDPDARVGHLAVVVEQANGCRLVVTAARRPGASWCPVEARPAGLRAVHLARQAAAGGVLAPRTTVNHLVHREAIGCPDPRPPGTLAPMTHSTSP